MANHPFSAKVIVTEGWYNVKAYGALGDGATDDRVAIQAALDAAKAAGGGIVWFPPGKYIVSRAGVSAFCLNVDQASNIELRGVKGQSWIKATTGLPDATVPIIRWNRCKNITEKNMGFDGNWGNAVTAISAASSYVALPTATINVYDTTGFPASGTFTLVTPTSVEIITYTGKTATTFTGCTGGTATLMQDMKVGYVDDNTGINQTTQTDPSNYGNFIRSCDNFTIDSCLFYNIYGDAIWMGGTADVALQNVSTSKVWIVDTNINLCARNGFSFISVDDVGIFNCQVTNIFAGAADSEPVNTPVRDVTIDSCVLGNWFNPQRRPAGQIALTIVGGVTAEPNQLTMARNYRIENNTVYGAILAMAALDIAIEHNRIIIDFFTDGEQDTAPIALSSECDGIKIRDNFIYDRVPGAAGGDHDGSICVRFLAGGTFGRIQTANVLIEGNTIQSKAGIVPISVRGVGGGAVGNVYTLTETGTATATSATTMTDGGKAWTVNQWVGWRVRIGTATASIVSNTATVLTLDTGSGAYTTKAWAMPNGDQHSPTPAAGDYVIFKPTGVCEVASNIIDCSDDGWGLGGKGMIFSQKAASTSVAGMRIMVHHNTLKNCDADGIYIDFQGTPPFEEICLYDNDGHDDQSTPTLTSLVRFNGTPNYNRLILRNNQPDPTVTTAVAGLTTGVWLVNGGLVPLWAGYGSPETVITAPIGAMYQRVDGGASSVLYMKESGTGNTGWVAYASPFSGVIESTTQITPTGLGTTTLASLGATLTVVASSTTAPSLSDSDYWSRTRKLRYQSAAGAGSVVSLRHAGGLNYIIGDAGAGFRIIWRFTIADTALVATANMFCGLIGSTAAPTDVAPSTLTNILGVGVDNGDTELQIYGAGAAAQGRTSLGANFPANTVSTDVYELQLTSVAGDGTVNWKVTRLNTGDTASGTLSGAAIPAAGTNLGCQIYRSNGGTGSAVAFTFHELFTAVPV